MMASLARRVATSSLCGMSPNGQSSSNSPLPYPTRMEKVKFGVPLETVCGTHNDIPSPLLVMILKLHKEAPYKKDIFRAPGNQANMRKLVQFLQTGRLVNIENYSVHTIASVLKKFLRKLPNGIFGPEREKKLFNVITWNDNEEKCQEINRIVTSLPLVTQHLLVLLFGTFRAVADLTEQTGSGMSSEAISISVAPSFFHSCISDGKFAKIEDVHRFKVASSIMKFIIDNFGVNNLFGQENYEYYARITRRVLSVDENWTFTFKYPPETRVPKVAEECQSTPTLCSHDSDTTLTRSHHNTTIEDSYARLSMSLEENFLKFSTQSNSNSPQSITVMPLPDQHHDTLKLEDLKTVNHYAESTKSLTFLPIVHERQTQRMKTRSEWFLKSKENNGSNMTPLSSSSNANRSQSMNTSKSLIRKTSSKEKRIVRRTSSKKDKENGNEHLLVKCDAKNSFTLPASFQKVTDSDCTECNVQQMNISYSYKPHV